jgi:hypothetical protein
MDKKLLIAVLLFLAGLSRCSSQLSSSTPFSWPDPAVYAAGSNGGDNYPAYYVWNNGAVVELDLPVLDQTGYVKTDVSALAISGCSVYIAGNAAGPYTTQLASWAVFSANSCATGASGGLVKLSAPDVTVGGNKIDAASSYARAMVVSDPNVYIAGSVLYPAASGIPTAYSSWVIGSDGSQKYDVLCRNSDLDSAVSNFDITSIFVKGGTLYVAGDATVQQTPASGTDPYLVKSASYWTRDSGLKTIEPSTVTSALTRESYATSICVGDDGSIYVAGFVSNNQAVTTAAYWKNADEVTLPGGSKSSQALAILVAGQDVYAAGYTNSGASDVATYWKNGVPVYLSDGTAKAQGKTIYAAGNDIYVAGSICSPAGTVYPVYWKNGVVIALPGGKGYVSALSLNK